MVSSGKHNNPTKYTLSHTMFDSSNLWLIKPTSFNRGRGVSVFSTVDQFRKLVNDYSQGVEIPQQLDKQEKAAPSKQMGNTTIL